MLKKYFHKNITWYRFLGESKESFRGLAFDLNIDGYIVEKFTTSLTRDKALILKNNIFIATTIPNLVDGQYVKQEIKFILGNNYMISYSDKSNEGVDYFTKNFEKNANFKKSDEFENPVIYSFLHIIEKIYGNMIYELTDVFEEIEEIEKNIFKGNEKNMVRKISETNRKLINFGKFIRNHEETWEVFLPLSKIFFKDKHSHDALESITISYQKVVSELNSLKDSLKELRATNNSLLNSKVADTSRAFTLIAFLTLPITLFISILSVPTKQGHFLATTENDFFVILIISGVLFTITLIISKIKKLW